MTDIQQQDIVNAAAHLSAGELVVYPTETSYGLGANAFNHEAVQKVFAAKQRSEGVTLPVIVANLAMAKQIVNISASAQKIIDAHWPGPLTLVLPAKKGTGISPHVIADDGSIALRVSGSPIAQALCAALGKPIISTSANISNKPSCYTIDGVQRQFADVAIAAYLDAGELEMIPSTTIVRVRDKKIDVLRQGSVVV